VTPQAQPAQKTDVRALSRTMARAFYDDPVMMWLLPQDKTRMANLRRVFGTMTRHHYLARGGIEVARDGPDIGAAALWAPPDQWRDTRGEELAMAPTFLRVFGLRVATGRACRK
jgi:hypothetical protein